MKNVVSHLKLSEKWSWKPEATDKSYTHWRKRKTKIQANVSAVWRHYLVWKSTISRKVKKWHFFEQFGGTKLTNFGTQKIRFFGCCALNASFAQTERRSQLTDVAQGAKTLFFQIAENVAGQFCPKTTIKCVTCWNSIDIEVHFWKIKEEIKVLSENLAPKRLHLAQFGSATFLLY